MAFLDTDHDVAVGTELIIDVRGRRLTAHVNELPFVRAGQAHHTGAGAS
jgi:glycine cleavage system aminomethyltransferase T